MFFSFVIPVCKNSNPGSNLIISCSKIDIFPHSNYLKSYNPKLIIKQDQKGVFTKHVSIYNERIRIRYGKILSLVAYSLTDS